MTGWQILAVRVQGPEATELPELSMPTVLVFPCDTDAEALAGTIAAATGAAVLGRITALEQRDGHLLATRASHGGRVAIELGVKATLAVATANVMPQCHDTISLGQPGSVAPDRSARPGQAIALGSAPVVLAGGRGLDVSGFQALGQAAALIGGAVAASLPAIDLGLAPVSQQVGQSGKFVTPRLYLAAGLSGTPQHLAGIGSATRLVAINSDPDAAIFGFAEAGIVADASVLLPLLVGTLEKKLAEEKA